MCSTARTILRCGGRSWAGLALAAALVVGCSPKRAIEVFPPASSRDAIERARDILSLYAEGQPVGSESVGFDVMVQDVQKVDPDAAAVLERGLADLTARPGGARAIAARLLEQLPASAAAVAQSPKAPGP